MKHTFGQALTLTVFGESHGPEIGATLDGIAPGIAIDESYIRAALNARRPAADISTPRKEPDNFRIISGVYNGYTTGSALTILIPNTDVRSADYAATYDLPRPGHADLCAHFKYHGFQDVRGGGQFSGRITAVIVAAGAIVRQALLAKGIRIATHIQHLGGIEDAPLTEDTMTRLDGASFPTVSEACADAMQAVIRQAREDGDSIGGTLETLITGMPAGVGEPYFDSMESVLAHMLFSIPAVKGVAFGDGFGLAAMRGSQANDAIILKDGAIATKTNHCGGICGGITNGMPLRITCAVKPTPSIAKEQRTVSLSHMEERTLSIKGRHDGAVVHRARAVVDAACALVLADMLTLRFGTDYLATGGVQS